MAGTKSVGLAFAHMMQAGVMVYCGCFPTPNDGRKRSCTRRCGLEVLIRVKPRPFQVRTMVRMFTPQFLPHQGLGPGPAAYVAPRRRRRSNPRGDGWRPRIRSSNSTFHCGKQYGSFRSKLTSLPCAARRRAAPACSRAFSNASSMRSASFCVREEIDRHPIVSRPCSTSSTGGGR